MKKYVSRNYFILNIVMFCHALMSAGLAIADDTVACPELTLQDLKTLHLDREIEVEGHKWYLKSTYKENHSFLGTFLPYTISAKNIELSKTIKFDQQISDRECQYILDMPSMHATGYLLFSRIGK